MEQYPSSTEEGNDKKRKLEFYIQWNYPLLETLKRIIQAEIILDWCSNLNEGKANVK